MTHPSRRSILGGMIVLGGSALVPGCNIVGPIASIFEGEPTIPAQHILTDVPTVVFVDDRSNRIPLSSSSIRRSIATRTSQDLIENEALTTVIAPGDAMGAAATRDKHDDLVPIAEIGEAVGATQIIYVEMMRFAETPDGVIPRPTANCLVSVLDLEQRTRVFPFDTTAGRGVPVSANLPEMDPQAFRSPSSRIQIHKALAEVLGTEIGKLFYEHKQYEIGDRLDG